MNVQEYISSGILESYVLGFCSHAEAEEVERLIREHPSIREEIRIIQDTLEQVAAKSAIDPPGHLKSRIWDAIREEEEESVPVFPIGNDRPADSDPVIGTAPDHSGNSRRWLAYAASFALIFAASSLAIFFYAQNRKTENQLALVKSQNKELESKQTKSADSLGKIAARLNLIAQAGTRKVDLSGVPASKDSKAVVFWNESKKQVILAGIELPQAPTNKQYQLWALVDGVPVDAGVFDNAANGMIEMKSIDKSQAFAITLEPKGGSVSPHLEALCVIGNV